MTIYFVKGYKIMVVYMMEIVEMTGGIVAEGGDSWWSSIVETAGGIVIVGRDPVVQYFSLTGGGCQCGLKC